MALGFVAGLVTMIVAIVWVVPLVYGPFSVDCGAVEPAQCDRAWRTVAGEEGSWLPVTAVRVVEATGEPGECGTFLFERWIFANVHTRDCL